MYSGAAMTFRQRSLNVMRSLENPYRLKEKIFRLIFWRHVKSTEPGPLTFSFFTRPIPLASYLADFP